MTSKENNVTRTHKAPPPKEMATSLLVSGKEVFNNVGSFLLRSFSKAISKLDSNGTSIDQTSQVIASKDSMECFIGPCPHRDMDRDCCIGSKFCKFYFY